MLSGYVFCVYPGTSLVSARVLLRLDYTAFLKSYGIPCRHFTVKKYKCAIFTNVLYWFLASNGGSGEQGGWRLFLVFSEPSQNKRPLSSRRNSIHLSKCVSLSYMTGSKEPSNVFTSRRPGYRLGHYRCTAAYTRYLSCHLLGLFPSAVRPGRLKGPQTKERKGPNGSSIAPHAIMVYKFESWRPAIIPRVIYLAVTFLGASSPRVESRREHLPSWAKPTQYEIHRGNRITHIITVDCRR